MLDEACAMRFMTSWGGAMPEYTCTLSLSGSIIFCGCEMGVSEKVMYDERIWQFSSCHPYNSSKLPWSYLVTTATSIGQSYPNVKLV